MADDETLHDPDVGRLPRDPVRYAIWAVSGFLALLGLFFGVISGVPWPSKTQVEAVGRDIQRLERTDDTVILQLREQHLNIQGLQYELRQQKEHQAWLEAELERLKEYVYPAPNSRSRPRSTAPARPPDALGAPQKEYPGKP